MDNDVVALRHDELVFVAQIGGCAADEVEQAITAWFDMSTVLDVLIDTREIASETFISVSNTAPALRVVIDDYVKRTGLDIKPDHEVDNLAMAMSLVASTRGVALLPASHGISCPGP